MRTLIIIAFLLLGKLSYSQSEFNILVGTSISSNQESSIFSNALIAPSFGLNMLWKIKSRLHFVANIRYEQFGFNLDGEFTHIKTLNWNYGLSLKSNFANYGLVISYSDPLAYSSSSPEKIDTNNGINLMAISDYRINKNLKFHLAYTHGLNQLIQDVKFQSVTVGLLYNLINYND